MQPHRIAAIVVTFNRRDLLTRCLEALEAQTYPLQAIIVIDNASTDGTRDFMEARRSTGAAGIIYTRLKDNTGGAGGFHSGVAVAMDARVDWLWLMDDDAVPERDALQHLIEAPGVMKSGLAVPGILNPDGSPQQRVIDSVVSNDRLFLGMEHDDLKEGGIIFSYPLLGLLVHRSSIEAVGNVRSDYFIQADDLEWTLRLSEKQGIRYVPRASIKHFDEVRLDRARLFGKSYLLLSRKDLWKDYYGFRNLILTMRSRRLPSWRWTASKMLFQRLSKRIILRKDLLFSLNIYVRAYFHGMTGQAGRLLAPGAQRWMSGCA